MFRRILFNRGTCTTQHRYTRGMIILYIIIKMYTYNAVASYNPRYGSIIIVNAKVINHAIGVQSGMNYIIIIIIIIIIFFQDLQNTTSRHKVNVDFFRGVTKVNFEKRN